MFWRLAAGKLIMCLIDLGIKALVSFQNVPVVWKVIQGILAMLLLRRITLVSINSMIFAILIMVT